ncbi:siderophore-interacting protein [Allokutzneria oryzae]|uniref:Siderophore-interacting protein n=1 Tax=Allokutzneria oryzae TaxID=1378989 RepID=A0ABV6A3J8_9PSEU
MLPVRTIEVTKVRRITPRMARITFGGPDLAGFGGYTEPDQQVKLYFPKPGHAVPVLPDPDAEFLSWYQTYNEIPEADRPWMRSYTLSGHDSGDDTIDIDFVLHDHAGPATLWAMSAEPGDKLGMFGPSDDFARPVPLRTSVEAADWLLVAGDETALPAIGTLLGWLPPGHRALVYVEVADAAEHQRFDTRADAAVHWVHRDGAETGPLVDALREAEFPPGSVFAWIAAESGVVRSLRRHLIGDRGVGKRAIEFTGHWRRALTQDDAPTAEDIAEAQERYQ